MRIALDYDQTYTADRKAWDDFIILFTARGHDVMICAFRDRDHDWNPDLTYLETTMKVPVLCTAGVAKKFWCENFGPGEMDIWIDDRPAGILNNSSMTPVQLAEWRADNKAAEAAEQARAA